MLRRDAHRGLIGAIAAVLILTACSPPPVEPAEAGDCGDLVTVGVRLVEDYLAEVETLPSDVVLEDGPLPAELQILVRRGQELDVRVAELGCEPFEIGSRIREETADLTATTPAGELVLQVVRSEGFGPAPPATGE